MALKEHLERLCDIAFVPNNEVNIHYMYYDLVSEQSGPEIRRTSPRLTRSVRLGNIHLVLERLGSVGLAWSWSWRDENLNPLEYMRELVGSVAMVGYMKTY